MNKALLVTSLGIISYFCLINHTIAANETLNMPKGGPYAGLQGGTGGMMTKIEDESTVITHKHELHNGFAGRILGGYSWADYPFTYGPEVGYSLFPNNRYTLDGNKYKYRGYAFDALAVGKYYFTRHLNIIGKIGIAYNTQNYETAITDTNQSKHQWLPEISLGFGFDIDSDWGVDLTFTHMHGKEPKALLTSPSNVKKYYEDVASVNLVMLGIICHLD